MFFSVLAFLAGITTLQFFPELPSIEWYYYLAIAVFLSLAFIKPIRAVIIIIICFICGFLWMIYRSSLVLDWQLPKELEKQDLVITGTIVSLPIEDSKATSFDFKVTSIPHHPKIKLNWYTHPPLLTPGDEWQLTVQLKRPHGLANPGSFDTEKWLFQNRIRATGSVKSGEKLASHPEQTPFEFLRYQLREELNPILKPLPYGRVLLALTIGDQTGISDKHWDTLRATGTTHLISVSGLHIALVAGLVFVIVRLSWRGRLLAPIQAAAIGAILAAFIYSALAGFAIPTIRSLIMIIVFMLILLMKRFVSLWQAWSIALVTILLIDPLSTLSVGFWLSFGSVALILYTTEFRVRPKGLWWKWGRLHLLLAIGLVPLTALFFQQWSLVSPLANFIAIPWVSFIVTPLALLGCLPLIGEWLLAIAHFCFKALWPILEFLAKQPWAEWNLTPANPWLFLLATLGILLLFAPRGLYGRWLGGIFFLPLWFTAYPKPTSEELWFTLLDIGQGLAAVIQTQYHTLIYDTGPDNTVLIPFLKTQGIEKIDTLIISHGDLDHIGGARALTQAIPVQTVLSGTPQAIDWIPSTLCQTGKDWQWDNIKFTFLHPITEAAYSDNNASCVLKIESGQHTLLLTGDIEKIVEEELVVEYGNTLKADVLVVPHHGSNSSSTEVFLQHVQPQIALVPAGYLNRYKHPSPKVLKRYMARQIPLHNTALQGAISMRFSENSSLVPKPQFYRIIEQKFWQAK